MFIHISLSHSLSLTYCYSYSLSLSLFLSAKKAENCFDLCNEFFSTKGSKVEAESWKELNQLDEKQQKISKKLNGGDLQQTNVFN